MVIDGKQGQEMKILLMEDDPVLGDIMTEYLSRYYEVHHAFDAEEALNMLDIHKYDLLIFDVNVPGQSGIELLSDIRGFQNTTPAIIVTAYEDTRHLKESFDAGAHDYIKKPFDLEELKLRIEKSKVLFGIEQDVRIEISDEIVYSPRDRLLHRDNTSIGLKPKEAKLLDYFIAHPGRVVSAEELVRNIWSYETLPTDATLRSHIRNLRALIGGERITTLRGVGYRYD